jgi:hypothetical protein
MREVSEKEDDKRYNFENSKQPTTGYRYSMEAPTTIQSENELYNSIQL